MRLRVCLKHILRMGIKLKLGNSNILSPPPSLPPPSPHKYTNAGPYANFTNGYQANTRQLKHRAPHPPPPPLLTHTEVQALMLPS